jgi:Kef-type K+ transport system membrane component KefB
MLSLYQNMRSNAVVVVSLAIMLFSGFLITRITRRLRLPNVTGYIIVGILIGPYILNLIPQTIIDGMDFVTDVALAFIAFGVGRYLKLSTIRESSTQVLIMTLCESLLAAAIVIVVMIFVFKLPVPFALLLGAIGSATAPASTIMTIRQYKAKGNFVNMLLQVVVLDDAVALLAFSICAAVAQALDSSSGAKVGIMVLLLPIFLNIAAVGLGILAGFLLKRIIDFLNTRGSKDNRLIVGLAMILSITGLCSAFDISPLLSCMAMGTTYVNISDNRRLFKQINNFAAPVLTLFFVLSGMRLSMPALFEAGIIGVGYFIVRIIGKYSGAFIGAELGKASPEIRKYFGLALIPQAGVSIGLAFLGQRILPPDMGAMLSTIILSSSVLYEMIGPVSAKLALFWSHAITSENVAQVKVSKPSQEEK